MSSFKKQRQKKYCPFVRASDVHFRSMTVFIFLALYLGYHHCLVSTLHGIANTPLISNDICDVINSPDDNSLFCVDHGTASDMNGNNYVTGVQWPILNAVFDIAQRLLMLAAYVELNPGPVDNIDAILDNLLQAVALSSRVMSEFKYFEEGTMQEFKAIRNDVSSIKSDVDLLKEEHHNICQEFITLKSMCMSNITKTLTNEQRVTELQNVVENMRLDIDALHDKLRATDSTIDALLEDVEQLKRKNISSNMHIFSLNANVDETQAQLKSKVINKVLKIAQSDIDKRNDNMKPVKVIPTQNSLQDNFIIVTFRFDDDEFRVCEGRNLLRAQGIRVGDDLTFKQHETLRLLNKLGKTGYYAKGRLVVKNKPGPTTARNIRGKRTQSYADEPSVSSNAYPAPIPPDVNHLPHDVIAQGQVAMDQ